MGMYSGNHKPQKDGRAPRPCDCHSEDLVSRFSQHPLTDDSVEKLLKASESGAKLLSGVPLEPVVGFYLAESVNLTTDLISIFALAIRKLRTEYSAHS